MPPPGSRSSSTLGTTSRPCSRACRADISPIDGAPSTLWRWAQARSCSRISSSRVSAPTSCCSSSRSRSRAWASGSRRPAEVVVVATYAPEPVRGSAFGACRRPERGELRCQRHRRHPLADDFPRSRLRLACRVDGCGPRRVPGYRRAVRAHHRRQLITEMPCLAPARRVVPLATVNSPPPRRARSRTPGGRSPPRSRRSTLRIRWPP